MNLKRLHYFWFVGHAGGVTDAAKQLHLTPQTVSAQIKLLERELGVALFRPAGRGLELTEAGRAALSYADEIIALGDEMSAALRVHADHVLPVFRLGISGVVPKSLAHRLIAPLSRLPEPLRLVCRQGDIDALLAELAVHRLDAVVTDRPMPPGLAIRGHNHKLGESAAAFFAPPRLADGRAAFPHCLNGAPLLLPGNGAAVRGEIERWLGEVRIFPQVLGEFDDSGLMKAYAQDSGAYFPAPAVLTEEICELYGVREVGRVEGVREVFWLISTERRVRHPAVRAVLDAVRAGLFTPRPGHSGSSHGARAGRGAP
jgi:LysR family transcriptional activator of nhaA